MAVTEKPADDDRYEDAPKNPTELADNLSEAARASLIAEAVEQYWGGWPNRRSWFIKNLGEDEARWFG